jgi:hypothetical protein
MATGRISNETRRTILEMAAAGESAEDIAQSLGRNLGSVSRIIEGSTGKASKKSGRRSKKSGRAAAPEPAAAAAPKARRSSSGTLTHHFWLRPGLEINLELPADLSSDEAQRLASVIQSLPFHG